MTLTYYEKKWQHLTFSELREISTKWCKRYSLDKLRALKENYSNAMSVNGISQELYEVYNNRWLAAQWAINAKLMKR